MSDTRMLKECQDKELIDNLIKDLEWSHSVNDIYKQLLHKQFIQPEHDRIPLILKTICDTLDAAGGFLEIFPGGTNPQKSERAFYGSLENRLSDNQTFAEWLIGQPSSLPNEPARWPATKLNLTGSLYPSRVALPIGEHSNLSSLGQWLGTICLHFQDDEDRSSQLQALPQLLGNLVGYYASSSLPDYAREILDAITDHRGVQNLQESGRKDSKEEQVAVLFADIRGFTPLTNRLRTRDVRYADPAVSGARRSDHVAISDLLKTHLEPMCRIVYSHGGIVDKFIGDAVMAFFREAEPGFPDPAAVRSVRAALEMQKCFKEQIFARWERQWLSQFRQQHNEFISPDLGIGIAYGGAEFARFYGKREGPSPTIVGEVVNLASRLEGIAGKEHELPTGKRKLPSILISGTVFEQISSTKELPYCEDFKEPIELKGIAFPQRAFGIVSNGSK